MSALDEAMRKARETAVAVVDERADPLEACLVIYDLYEELKSVLPLNVLEPFLGIGSELDGAPIGPVRRYWAEEAVAERSAALDQYRVQVEAGLRGSFRELLAALGE
jgi:hypothetical protein